MFSVVFKNPFILLIIFCVCSEEPQLALSKFIVPYAFSVYLYSQLFQVVSSNVLMCWDHVRGQNDWPGVIPEWYPLQPSTSSAAIPSSVTALEINTAGACLEESKSLGSKTCLCMEMLELKDRMVSSTLACIYNKKTKG